MADTLDMLPRYDVDGRGELRPRVEGDYVKLADVRAALASRPAEVDDSQLRNVAQFLLDRYDELRNKKGAPSTAEFELLRLALAPSHTTNKEK